MIYVTVVTHNRAAGVLQPTIQALDFPAPFEPAQRLAILSLRLAPLGSMRGNKFNVASPQPFIERITVIGLVTDQPFGLSRCETVFKRPVDKGDLIRPSTRYVKGDRKATAACNCHDLATLAPLGLTRAGAPFWVGTKVPSMKHSAKFSRPRSSKSWAKASKMRSKTPAWHHSWKRR